MSEENTRPASPPPPEPEKPASQGGVGIESGGEVTVGGDVAGRDVVKTTTSTTHVGFSATQVQKLLITVGLLVFVTAGCFFSGGLLVGGAAFVALDRQVASHPQAANEMQAVLNQLSALPPGQPFDLTFSETQISSYLRFIVGPQIGLAPQTGKVRLLEPGKLVLAGEVSGLGNLPVLATFDLQNTPGQPLHLTSAAVQILRLGGSRFGWVWVPTSFLQSLADQVNQFMGTNYQLTGWTTASEDPNNPAWTVSGVTR